MSPTLGMTGMDPATESALRSAFDQANARLQGRWRLVPEADAFEWVPFARLPERCAKSMFTLLDTRLALPDLLARLRTKAPPA